MALYTIGDTHLSLGGNKPMDVFDGWQNYVQRLEAAWRGLVRPEDTVVLAGDISWAMNLQDTAPDFAFLQELPGRKLLMKGNHDYWWTTASKMQAFLEEQGFTSLHVLHNNAFEADGMSLSGTRGWFDPSGDTHAEKILNREAGRLRLSLEYAAREYSGAEQVAFFHYPPFAGGAPIPQFEALLQEFCVKQCYYGHLHSASVRWAVQGDINGIRYKLVSADMLNFTPYRIKRATV